MWSRNNWAVIQCVDTHKPTQKNKKNNPGVFYRGISDSPNSSEPINAVTSYHINHNFPNLTWASQQQACSHRQWYAVKSPVCYSFSLRFMRQPVLLSCIFTPCLFMRDRLQGFPHPREKNFISLCFCLFACLFIYFFTFDLVFGDWSFITGMFYSNAVLGLCLCACMFVYEQKFPQPLLSFLALTCVSFPCRSDVAKLVSEKKRVNEQLLLHIRSAMLCPSGFSQTPTVKIISFISVVVISSNKRS